MVYIQRSLKLPLNKSFFLFGARNTGKSTLLKQTFSKESVLWIDLLNPDEEERYSMNPSNLSAEVLAADSIKYVIIDEIQKIPKLLDVVHQLIESSDKKFIMTGSSARKLRHGGANLLAGRAFVYNLFPFTSLEIVEDFQLDHALRWGTLPSVVYSMKTEEEKMLFLQAYSQTYLKEEIWMEQLVKKLDPFRKFLEVSAQCNGQIINYSNLSRDVGVDDKTIKQYFSILEDTLVGFFLEPFHHSLRKRQSLKPKFYYFDTGIKNALARTLSIPLVKSTSAYGNAFEHFIILESLRLASYNFPEFRFSYLRTKDDAEVDLIVERPGEKLLFIEIKSTNDVSLEQLSTFSKLAEDFRDCEAICFSQDPRRKNLRNVQVFPWLEGLKKFFTKKL
jgi:predicted AAA+ superfamily ATPase